jgi:hypothetical protein
VPTPRKINLPGRRCQCGALLPATGRRCEKCQARSSWYRHNCHRPRRAASGRPRAGLPRTKQTPAHGQRRDEEH